MPTSGCLLAYGNNMKQLNISILLTIILCMKGIEAFAHHIEVANEDGVTIKEVGDTFIGKTEEGTDLLFMVTSINPMEVQVGNNVEHSQIFSATGPLTIPSSINGYTVTGIGKYAFSDWKGSAIIIPNTVRSIGAGALIFNENLKELRIPASVTDISEEEYPVITGCTGLESIIVDEGNTTYDSRDNCNAIIHTASNKLIYGCKNSKIPDNIKSIGWAFRYCRTLTEITIPDGVENIQGEAFRGTGLKNIVIPASVNHLGGAVFWENNQMESVTFLNPNPQDYNGWLGLEDVNVTINVPKGSKSIYKDIYPDYVIKEVGDTFIGKTEEGTDLLFMVTSINPMEVQVGNNVEHSQIFSATGPLTIPSSINGYTVTGIGKYAFSDWKGSAIIIPNTVRSIGAGALIFNENLKELRIPASVTDISEEEYPVITGCTGLESIIVDEGNTTYDSRDNCNAIIHTASNKLIYGCKNSKIPDNIKSIGWAFRYCRTLTEITIPDGVENIQGEAFRGTGLKNIVIPASVNHLGGAVFWENNQMESVTFLNPNPQDYNGWLGLEDVNVTINVPKGSKSIYKDIYPDYVIKEILKGDMNNDGYVNAADVTLLARYIVGLELSLPNGTAADVNDDNKIDIADVAALIALF